MAAMFVYPKEYDVIVLGAGHAGVEAALAASRIGCQTLLLTINADTIGQMSCNPAIGGQGKGQLVREIDALGGEMGKATDMTGIQFRMLNTKRGPAVQAPRAQCDKKAYQFYMKWVCEKQSNLDIQQGQATSLIHRDGVILGVTTKWGVQYNGLAVIVTTGTFLQGLMHMGNSQQPGGRSGDISSVGLSESLNQLGIQLGRLKTGTPPRLLKRTIDFNMTQVQLGDVPPPFFTHWKEEVFHMELLKSHETHPISRAANNYPAGSIVSLIGNQLPCYITHTTAETKRIVQENLHKSAMYSGKIEGIGPRYCPSIEDKIVKFSDKEQHQIFLEPEGISTDEIYVNGFSTSLPFDVQVDLVRTIVGCENAHIMRPAYAVEYDFANPTQIFPSLETKACRNLYLAGQINGTSGYEEAAAQGLMAGINAARRVNGQEPIVLGRDQAYIGVLIDDLVTKGTIEPYRMFSSRAEYRLLLRQDNADLRLSEIGFSTRLLSNNKHKNYLQKKNLIESEITRLEATRSGSETLAQLLRRPENNYHNLPGKNESLPAEVIQQVEISIKYAGYVNRQEAEIAKMKNVQDKIIPPAFDYAAVPSLRIEAKQKLSAIRPTTLGQASRISGVSPSDIGILMVWLKKPRSAVAPSSCGSDLPSDESEIAGH